MKHFLYKREVPLRLQRSPLADPPVRWCRFLDRVVSSGFTGLVFYAGYHPFEHLLDLPSFPRVAAGRKRDREQIRNRLNTVLESAHAHGLQTFLQHYVGHFPGTLARRIGLPLREPAARMTGFEHPDLVTYHRACYAEIFRTCPALTGLVFNYESMPNAGKLVASTAVAEANAMREKPFFLHRLWGFNDIEGMRRLVHAYRGTSMLAHKITDSKDVYAFPSADSRIADWKRALPHTDFLYIVGPCHNCAANLARIAWSDYDFVRELLADGARKGCDGFSFHQVNDSIAKDRLLGRMNVMHVRAMTDFMADRFTPPAGRVRLLAQSLDCSPRAATDLHGALLPVSRSLLRVYRQFCADSAFDGYLNPGRLSFMQDPFYYHPVAALNDQTRGAWRPVRTDLSWIAKTRPATVTPPGDTQWILDYADISGKIARCSPSRIAAAVERDCRQASHALERLAASDPALYRRAAPGLRASLVSAERAALEIRTAIAGYSLYFARSRRAMVAHVDRALARVRQDGAAARRLPHRQRTWHDGIPASVGRNLRTVRRSLVRGGFDQGALQAFIASHREYNEIRRVVRAYRLHGNPSLRLIRRRLRRALEWAEEARRPDMNAGRAKAVTAWKDFLEQELAHSYPPALSCAPGTATARQPLFRDHCFRSGEDYTEDFLGFFRVLDYERPAPLSFRITWQEKGLVFVLREEEVDAAARRRRWRVFEGSNDLSHVLRVYLDVSARCREVTAFHVDPLAGHAYVTGYRLRDVRVIEPRSRRLPSAGTRRSVSNGKTWIEITLRVPFAELGVSPRTGDTWGLNITAAPEIRRNRQYTWAPQYDSGIGNPYLFGRLQFLETA